MKHFEAALGEVAPSVTDETREQYAEIEKRFRRSDVERDQTGEDGVARTFQ
jgi:transitional endoplasmic reticulum ATPase